MRCFHINLILIAMLFLPACLFTREIARKTYFSKDYKKEFTNFEGYSKLYEGIYTGKFSKDSIVYYCFEFPNALDGSNRILTIDVPSDFYYYPKIAERKILANNGNKAFLIVKSYMDMKGEDLSEKLFYPTNTIPETPEILFTAMGYKEINLPDSITVLMIDFGNVYNRNIAEIKWEKQADGKYKSERMVYFQETSKDFSKPKLHWKIRSKLAYGMRHLAYLITIPIDIVTFPIQWIILKGGVR